MIARHPRLARLRRPLARRPIGAIVVTLALVVAPVGTALAHSPDPLLEGDLYAQNARLEFRWEASHVPPASMRTAILEAVVDSNATKLSKAPLFALDADGGSFVHYGGDVVCGVNGLACMRRDTPDAFRMYFREQGHVFDWGTMKWCQQYEKPPDGCYDAENVALDEFGHIHILGHHVNHSDERDFRDSVVQTFSRVKPEAGYDDHVFGRCDVATLQREYGLAAASTRVSTCLGNLDTTLGLAANDLTAYYDQPVTLTATLRIADLDAVKRLGGQNLSARVVTLERRPIGGAWTKVVTMAAGPTVGTYVHTTYVRYTADYRAVFAKPAGEGLAGETSLTVQVKLGSLCSSGCPQGADPAPAAARAAS